MRFSRHLSSHLTPEWRKKYIQYVELKKMLYAIVGSKKTLLGSWPQNREVLYTEEVVVAVDESLQEEFFRIVDAQLQSIAQFFRKEEIDLQCALSELEEKVLQLGMMTPRQANKQRRVLKRALSETYLNLVLLQNFQQLNHTGFRKILKKHDKLTHSSHGKEIFENAVCHSYFWTSKNVNRMIGQVEKSMIQLEDGNRTKAMNRLRVPPLGTEHHRSHWTSYFAGLFSGLLLLSIVVVCIAFSQWPTENYSDPHLEPSLRAMRAGLVLCIWFYGFAVNTFGWRRAGVNNVLIFEFDPRNYLTFMELFAVAGMVSVIWMAGLYLIAFSVWLHIPVYVGPLVMYGVLVSVLVLPFPVLRPRSRIWLLKRMGRIVCAPFFYVTFADFWIADQLTSLSLAMLDTEYFFCYLFYGQNASEGSVFSCGTGTYAVRVLVAVLPAWWRFAQCLRRYYDTKEANPHLINAGKYSTSFFVVVFSAVASTVIDGSLPFLEQSILYLTIFCLWVLSAVVSTSYTFSWDILMDWSLFPNIPKRCCRSDSLALRGERIYTYKFYYMLALVENFLFRTLWIFNLSVGNHVLRLLSNDIIATIAGVLEIVRRFVWNFFRVENEHVNNVGHFRAVRDLSLYPVDLSGQADQEENEDFLDRRGSLERREALPGKKRRKVTRKLSNELIEVSGRKKGSIPRMKKGRKRSLSATLPAELRQFADEDCGRGSPPLGYDPHRIGNHPPSPTSPTSLNSDNRPLDSPQCYNLIYSSSPQYGNSVLQDTRNLNGVDFVLQDNRNKNSDDVFRPDTSTTEAFPHQDRGVVPQVQLEEPQDSAVVSHVELEAPQDSSAHPVRPAPPPESSLAQQDPLVTLRQSDSTQSDSAQSDSAQSEGTQSDSTQSEGTQSDSAQSDSAQSEGTQSDRSPDTHRPAMRSESNGNDTRPPQEDTAVLEDTD